MKPVEKIWFNGEMTAWNDAKIHILSHIIHYGYGVFEGIRCYETTDGRRAIFRLKEHLRRLEESAHILRLKNPWSTEMMTAACEQVVRDNGLKSCYIRPTLCVGYGKIGLAAIDNPPVCAVAAFEWGAYLGDEGIKNGIRCRVSSYAASHINSRMLKGKINGMYVNNILAKREALDDGYQEAILLDTNGYVTEGSGENIFVIRDGEVHTPPLTMVLAGVTRDSAIRMLDDMGMKVVERLISRDELYIADEVFLTGTAAEITPVREVDNRRVGTGKPGEITAELQRRFKKITRGEMEKFNRWLHYVK